ncbi:MAG: 4Fe-4S cluster-binding domain-containing protein [Methanobrevibacter sp.]|nr:4Fe-4S cluster-binding domain-containing protein [Methanobrevibacter sp.]
MNIISTQYTLKYKSFEIVVSGCKGDNGKHCFGCHSPETWDFNIGENYENQIQKILRKIKEANDLIDWIWVYGGEPLDNNIEELIDMLSSLKESNKPIVLFTRYSFDSIPQDVKDLCDYIKCGAYQQELTVEDNIQYGIKLATSNQHIYKKSNNQWK